MENTKTNKAKKRGFLAIALIAVTGFIMASCATWNIAPLMNVTGNYVDSTVQVAKRGEATSRIWIGIFGKGGFPTIESVAKENGITKIATVEHTITPGILFIWADYTTIVSGQ